MNTEFTRKELDDLIYMFDNDTDIQHLYYIYNIFLDEEKKDELAILLLSNTEVINSNTIEELYTYSEDPFLGPELETFYEMDDIPRDIYTQIMYVFKYGTIRKFFKNNWERYLPDIDVISIKNSEKMLLFQKALMQEFDRFSDIIDKVYNILDVDEVPNEYLNYLAQLIGYEREEDVILTNIAFRELLKNIIEVYRIKGTNFSFELFFNFLGFEVELKEYWFDKRYYYGISTNPETGETDKEKALFYLTSIKPTDYIPVGMDDPYIITEKDITETLDLNQFEKDIELGNYNIRQLLGIDLGYKNTPYEYFKTNVMEYKLTAINNSEESSLTEEQNAVIKNYSDFLTPIFIKNNIIVIIPPFEDDATSLILEDYLRQHIIDYLGNKYDDPATQDTEVKFYSRNITDKSFYWAIADYHNIIPSGEDPQYYENEILDKISEIMDGSSEHFWNDIINTYYGTGTIFDGEIPLRRREIFYPLRDVIKNNLKLLKEDKIKGTSITLGSDFDMKNGNTKRLSESHSLTTNQKASILSTNSTTHEITISDPDDTFFVLKPESYIKVIASIDKLQDGIYKISSLYKNGDDTVFVINVIDTPMSGTSQPSQGGFIQPYYEDWKLGNYKYPFLFDRVVEII